MDDNTAIKDSEPTKRTRKPFTLTDQQKTELEQVLVGRYWSIRQMNHARAVLAVAEGKELEDVADEAWVVLLTLRGWLRTYRKEGFQGLIGEESPVEMG